MPTSRISDLSYNPEASSNGLWPHEERVVREPTDPSAPLPSVQTPPPVTEAELPHDEPPAKEKPVKRPFSNMKVSRRKGKRGKVSPPSEYLPNFVKITSDKELERLRTDPKHDGSIVVFYTNWCKVCRRNKQTIVDTAKAHPDTSFMLVDCGLMEGMILKYNLSGVPTYGYITNQQVKTLPPGKSLAHALEASKTQ